MRIVRLSLTSWSCYAGAHDLRLEPKVYAVVAKRFDNAESSNWSGKSSFLEAITFALYGRHRYRTEDEFITHGEPSCEVELEFDDGTRVLRSRARGKSTRLYVYKTDNKNTATQQEAQEVIERMLGLTEQDFLNTCAFEQRQMARMVLAKPEERMGIVSGWLQLEPLEKCSDKTSEVIAEKIARLDQLKGLLTPLRNLPVVSEEELREADRDAVKARAEVETCQKALVELGQRAAAWDKVGTFDRFIAEGKEVQDRMSAIDVKRMVDEEKKTRGEMEETAGQILQLQHERTQRRSLAAGRFDGKCPVAEFECPATTVINARREENAQLLAKTEQEFAGVMREQEAATQAHAQVAHELRQYERSSQRLSFIREQVSGLAPVVHKAKEEGPPPDASAMRTILHAAQEQLLAATRRQEALRQAQEASRKAEEAAGRLRVEIELIETEVAFWREGGVIFRKARQKVAEDALSEIEDGANQTLRECAIPLEVQVRWAREGSGLARTCDACGAPHAASARVKECQRCGTARGPNIVNKLEIGLSDRSGAAEDLGGACIQLAASAWLRRVRGSSWETALLDEPMGQLDKALRRSFGAHLNTMLRSYGISQAFVVAHSPDFLESLPAKIEIVSKDGRSSIRVIA